ncbi:DUF5688 family protein [Oliverpabstia intestinalis]|uniref:DUF5688 family protein n=1 Tax=Oliverpabstia intestinalis TaxID=2606633 RepID=UPI003F8ACEAA
MFNFEDFCDYVQMSIKDHLPVEQQDAKVTINNVMKNNGLTLHGVVVHPEGQCVAPTIYLEGFFKQYEEGADLDSVMDKIAGTISEHLNTPEEFSDVAQMYSNYDAVKDKIVMAVVNTAKNRELLSQVPHTEREDLSLIYKVVVGTGADGIGSITIRNEHMEQWGVTVDEIHEMAMKNTKEILPVTVQTMTEVMREMFGSDGMPEEMAEMMFSDMPLNQQMFIISNKSKVNGAASMFYEDTLSELADKIGTSLYILPSSVHEVIAVSTDMGTPEALAGMVREVNGGQVAPEEQLSDHVYKFDAKAKIISLADTTMEQLKVSESNVNYEATQAAGEVNRPRHHR